MFRDKLRFVVLPILTFAAVILAVSGVHRFVLPIAGWIWPSLQSSFYDLGVYGAYAPREYVSSNLTFPYVSHPLWDDQCDHGYVFLTPQGASVEHPGPSILDGKGELVWKSEQYGTVANLKVQKYRGQNYLTFWAGHKAGTFGQGVYHMVSKFLYCIWSYNTELLQVGLDI